MSRYTNTLTPSSSVDDALEKAKAYLTSEGFSITNYNGEEVWKKGVGLMIGPQFVSLKAAGDKVQLEGWIKFALLPGVYVGEMGIEGFFAVIPKKMLKKRVEALQALIQ